FVGQSGQQSVRWIDNLGGPILEYERNVHPELVVVPGAVEPVFLRIMQQGHEHFITYRGFARSVEQSCRSCFERGKLVIGQDRSALEVRRGFEWCNFFVSPNPLKTSLPG